MSLQIFESPAHGKPILIVSYHIPPENVPASLRPFWFFKHLPEFGWRPWVLASSLTHWWQGAETAEGDPWVIRTPATGTHKRLLSFAHRIEPLASKYLLPGEYGQVWLPYALAAARKAMRERRFQAVFSTSPPSASHVVALRLKQRYGIRWVADFQDPLVGNPFRSKHPVRDRYDRALESRVIRHADFIVANTDTAAEAWRERYPEHRGRITHIWNGFDAEEKIGPTPLPPRRYRVLAHVGTVYGARHPGLLLASFGRLIESGALDPAAVKIQLVGPLDFQSFPDAALVRKFMERGWLECTVAYVPREEAIRVTAEADYLLLLDLNEKGAALQVPSKLYDYLRVGRPILAFTPENSPVAGILARGGVPHVCISPNAGREQLDRAVLEFLSLPTEPVEASAWFWQEFEARALTRSLARLLD